MVMLDKFAKYDPRATLHVLCLVIISLLSSARHLPARALAARTPAAAFAAHDARSSLASIIVYPRPA